MPISRRLESACYANLNARRGLPVARSAHGWPERRGPEPRNRRRIMNRKQLRQMICGSAVLITLGGGLLSQASGEGGLMSRLWDKRPRMSESRLNPRNWFGSDEAAVDDADLKPVVSVRPELTRNPFSADAALPAASGSTEKVDAAPASTVSTQVPSSDRSTGLPVIVPAETSASTTARADVPAPSIDSIFKRPSEDMRERARRRTSRDAIPDAAVAEASAPKSNELLAKVADAASDSPRADDVSAGDQVAPARKTLLRMPVPARPSREVAEPGPGRVMLGTLASDDSSSETGKGYIRLDEVSPVQSDANLDTEVDSAYERLLTQVKAASSDSASANNVGSTRAAPRLPDSLNVNPFAATESRLRVDQFSDRVHDAVVDPAGHPQVETSEKLAESASAAPSDAQTRSIDEMIARSRAEMNSTFLARQAEQERNAATGDAGLNAQDDSSSISQAGAVATGAAPPLMVPGGFDAGSFRTYGESERSAESQSRRVSCGDAPTLVDVPNRAVTPPTGLSRIEQAARSARQATAGPAIVPGPAGSGVVIDGSQYSVVKPRVTSNSAPSLSVPDNSTFRRLSYERRADELVGQVDRLANADSPGPILVVPGESLPRAEAPAMPAQGFPETAAEASSAAEAAAAGSPIDWPDEADLAPVKPKSGGTPWGLIVFCLALLTAGSHIAVSRFRQSRTAGSVGKS